MSKVIWPETVAILNAADIHKGDLDGPNATHCLYGWRKEEFCSYDEKLREVRYATADRDGPIINKTSKAIKRAIKELVPTKLINSFREVEKREIKKGDIVSFNDNPKIPKKLVARVWNRAMAYLGYVSNNPEVKHTKGKVIL
jgi:hypothetical protein